MADLEKAAATPPQHQQGDAGGGVLGSAARRWRAQDLLDRSASALRAGGWALSLLAFLVMACNEHGDWMQFDHYEEYKSVRPPPPPPVRVPTRRVVIRLLLFNCRVTRYIVAIGLLAFVYTTLQLVRLAVRLTGGQDLELRTGLLVDFAGDQVSQFAPGRFLLRLLPHIQHTSARSVFPPCSAFGLALGFLDHNSGLALVVPVRIRTTFACTIRKCQRIYLHLVVRWVFIIKSYSIRQR
jgi:hypothetical protein